MYSKQEMIAIGQLLKSVDDFDKRIRINNVPAVKDKNRVYIQARSYAIINKQKTFLSKYVGIKDQYSQKDLQKATDALKQRYRDHVNQELAAYNCKLEDFK